MDNLRDKFSKLYDNYIDKIYRFIFLKVSSQEVAEDLTSETFLRGWEAFKSKNKNSENPDKIKNPPAFLYQIARNLIVDHYREKSRTQVISIENTSITDPKTNLENKAVFNSDLELVRKKISELKEDYQNVIIWHYLDDLPINEVAKLLDRTEGATRVLLHRALDSLKKKINLDHEEG